LKYVPLIWAALRRRKARTVLTSLSIVTAFFLFGVLQGVNVAIKQAVSRMSPARLVVFSRSLGQPMPIAYAARIAAVPGVAAVTGMAFLGGTYQRPSNVQIVMGSDLAQYFKIEPEIKVAPGELAAALQTRTGVIVGRALAQKEGWKIGDRIPLHGLGPAKKDGSSDWVFDIVGLYDMPEQPESATQIFGNYDYINEERGSDQNTSIEFGVGLKDPHQATRVAQRIDELFANSPGQTRTQSERDFLESILRQVGDINYLVNAIVGAVLFTLLFLIANTMAQSVRERIPELAVLKTVGFSDSAVQWLVLAEALLLSLAGAMIGVGLAGLVIPLAGLQVQGSRMHVPHAVFAAAAGAGILLALVSGVPPALRARRLEVAAALAAR